MENATAYQFEVTRSHGDAAPTAFFVTLAEATAYCRAELGGFTNRSDDQAELTPMRGSQQVRFRGPHGLRWVEHLCPVVPMGTTAPRFNPGQAVRLFGVERRLYVQSRSFADGTWQYQFQGFTGIYPEALVFGPNTEPTPPATPAALALPEPEPERPTLLFSLHSTKLGSEADEQGQRTWRELPPRLFLRVKPEQPRLTRIAALCGTTGRLFPTSAYDFGPFRLESGREFATVQRLADYFAAQHEGMMPAVGAAMLLTTDGSTREIRPTNGKSFELSQLYEALSCDYVDVIAPQHGPYQGYIMVIDDEGKFRERPINPLATAAWYQTYPLADYSPVDVVAGPVLLMKSALFK